jgi:predicted esterase
MSSRHVEEGPHRGQPVLTVEAAGGHADAAMIMVHGRGASARDILGLVPELRLPQLLYLAPEAAQHTWYPYSFLAQLDDNEPGLSSGLAVIGGLLADLDSRGIPADRTFLLGFSQGACLVTEFAARNARRYGGVFGLTGGLIGPPGTPHRYDGSLSGTAILLGSSDPDPHVPWSRVEETAEVFRGLGAAVDLRRYPGMGHTINAEELDLVRNVVHGVLIGETDHSDRGEVHDEDPVSRQPA